jgi:estrogen-related receptor beta like 1
MVGHTVNGVKSLDIPFEFGPIKLRQGFGEAVLYVLNALSDKALQSMRYKFKKPVHRSDE